MKLSGIFERLSKSVLRRRDFKTIIGMARVYKNWHEILLDSLGLFYKPERTIVLRNGIRFVARDYRSLSKISSAKLVGNEIWVRKSYNPPGFEINKSDVVVDIGAHIGAFSLYAAYHGGIVYSYEPSPGPFKLLKKNIKLNGFEKVIFPFQLAVGGKRGKRKMYMSEAEVKGQVQMFRNDTYNTPLDVECTTLKDILNSVGHIDFLKCDGEGSEFEIFFNTPKKYLEKIEKISLEYHEGRTKFNKEDLKKFFENMGFDVNVKPEFKTLGTIYAKRAKFK